MNSSSILRRPSWREFHYAGECALKSPSTRKGFGSCSKSLSRERVETGVLGDNAVPGLPWSYTPSRGCGTSIGIDPSPIQKNLTSQLGSMSQRCPSVSGEGNG
ncbi:hypothetical protein PoB_001961800 [Plakobranchus ocellatus]|uniref:Uncharacterized protein n=1 Tax=Plakobranchus ocellatus TaxID=259542 RepID=A0AAV3ZF66_9GAST|nr:hypothetical protein PoB_001961800 [Plakobranchus ocellatus]